MSDYKRKYREYFGYGEQDVVVSEISGKPAADPHHILWRSQGGGDEKENLIALTRDEHDRAHFKKKPFITYEELVSAHRLFMEMRSLLSKYN